MARLPGDPLANPPLSEAPPQPVPSGGVNQVPREDVRSSEETQQIATARQQSLSHGMSAQYATPAQSVTVPLRALSSGRRWRDTARWIGLALFVVGAGLLAFVFWKAITGLNNFAQPDYLSMQFNRVAGDDIASRIQATVVVFGKEILSVLYLLLTGYLASAIASKGIQFFAASEAVIDEAVEAGIEE